MSRRDRWSGRTRARGRRQVTDVRAVRNADALEDDWLVGVTGALTAGGWLWTHVGRSDLAQLQGQPGVPDIIAVHPQRRRMLVLEIKAEHGDYRPFQEAWLDAFRGAGVDARTVRPGDYDALIDELAGDRLISRTGR